MAEHCYNFGKDSSSRGLASWFDEDRRVKAAAAYNKHGYESTHLPGGTGLLAMWELIPYIRSNPGDFRGLGRWQSWSIYSAPSHKTRVVVFYAPGRSKPRGLKTCYQQHLTYIQENDLDTTPRKMFEDDFLLALRTWRSQGERLLIFGDANEHILDGKYTRRLLEDPLLGLVEETSRHWGDSPPNTHVMGSVPIDGVWRTPDIEVNNLIMLPFSHSVGDHRTIILDVTTLSMIGSYQHKVVYPPCRPLSNKHKQSVARYVSQLERQMDIHIG